MIRFIGISVLGLAIAAPFAPSADAQAVNSGNYRSYARCSETVIDGKVYSTFGPGPCPPGTKYSPTYGSYENDMAMRRSQAAVDALGRAQQSLVEIAKKMASQVRIKSEEILAYNFIEMDRIDSAHSPYSSVSRTNVDISQSSIASIGEVVFSRNFGILTECMVPHFSHEKRAMGGWSFSIISDEPACRMSKSDPVFYPVYMNAQNATTKDRFIYGLYPKSTKSGFDVCFRYQGLSTNCKKGIGNDEISFAGGFLGDRRLTKEVVSFAGVRGDGLLFLYRPDGFPDQSRPDRVEEVTANLSESRVVKVGPYTFEVVDWSPTNIVAKLVAVN